MHSNTQITFSKEDLGEGLPEVGKVRFKNRFSISDDESSEESTSDDSGSDSSSSDSSTEDERQSREGRKVLVMPEPVNDKAYRDTREWVEKATRHSQKFVTDLRKHEAGNELDSWSASSSRRSIDDPGRVPEICEMPLTDDGKVKHTDQVWDRAVIHYMAKEVGLRNGHMKVPNLDFPDTEHGRELKKLHSYMVKGFDAGRAEGLKLVQKSLQVAADMGVLSKENGIFQIKTLPAMYIDDLRTNGRTNQPAANQQQQQRAKNGNDAACIDLDQLVTRLNQKKRKRVAESESSESSRSRRRYRKKRRKSKKRSSKRSKRRNHKKYKKSKRRRNVHEKNTIVLSSDSD